MSDTRSGKPIAALNFGDISVGDLAELSHTIEQDDVDAFARLTGDYNPLHVDEEFSRKTLFRRPVVHGMLSASFISTMIGTLLPGQGALRTAQTLEFLLPAFVGDRITVRAIVEQKSAGTRALVLTTMLAVEFGPKGIRVNVIAPGMTQTEMLATLPDKVKVLTKMQTPLRRLGEADDVAVVAEFLLSSGARHSTGETVRVCGGTVMC